MYIDLVTTIILLMIDCRFLNLNVGSTSCMKIVRYDIFKYVAQKAHDFVLVGLEPLNVVNVVYL